MDRNTHDHATNRIWRRSDFKPKDGLYVELEEGCRVTHLDLPMRLRDFKTKELLGHVPVKAIISGSASLLKLLPQEKRKLLFNELLFRSGAELVSEGENKKLNHAMSIIKTQSIRYPAKHSVDWYSFLVYGELVKIKIEQEEDFEIHRHVGIITIDPSDFKKIKEGEVGIALHNGLWTFDYDGLTVVTDYSGNVISSAQTILAIGTRIDYFEELMPVINTLEIVTEVEKGLLSKNWVKERVAESGSGKSDRGWLSFIYYMPEGFSFSTLRRLLKIMQQ